MPHRRERDSENKWGMNFSVQIKDMDRIGDLGQVLSGNAGRRRGDKYLIWLSSLTILITEVLGCSEDKITKLLGSLKKGLLWYKGILSQSLFLYEYAKADSRFPLGAVSFILQRIFSFGKGCHWGYWSLPESTCIPSCVKQSWSREAKFLTIFESIGL